MPMPFPPFLSLFSALIPPNEALLLGPYKNLQAITECSHPSSAYDDKY